MKVGENWLKNKMICCSIVYNIQQKFYQIVKVKPRCHIQQFATSFENIANQYL